MEMRSKKNKNTLETMKSLSVQSRDTNKKYLQRQPTLVEVFTKSFLMPIWPTHKITGPVKEIR